MILKNVVMDTEKRFRDPKEKRRWNSNVRVIDAAKKSGDIDRLLKLDSEQRVKKFIERRRGSGIDGELLVVSKAGVGGTPPKGAALERILGTSDLMGVAFLERGLQVARTVGRIWIDGAGGHVRGYGTGFLVSPRLLLTNHHVLPDANVARTSSVEFDYEVLSDGSIRPTTIFRLDPATFFFSDDHLDYAIVAVSPTSESGHPVAEFGWNTLIEAEGKAIVAQWVNIIQHPNGEPKQLCIRENQIINMLEDFVQYRTDTAPGSSGSPVFNDLWEVVALHHSGVWETKNGKVIAIDGKVWTKDMGEQRIKWIANEGVRISRLIAHLRRQPMTSVQAKIFGEVFMPSPSPIDVNRPEMKESPIVNGNTISAGGVGWTLPLSISVGVGDATPKGVMVVPLNVSVSSDGGKQASQGSALDEARRELSKYPGVVGVKLGYVFKDGWITNERALVVTVQQKLTLSGLREAGIAPLPDHFKGLPVEVTSPSLEDLVRISRGPAVAEAAFVDPGVQAQEITYKPPVGASLDEVRASMRVVAHVSPDAGWAELSDFLGKTRRSLVVGMYDFGAPHIEEAVAALRRRASFKKLTLIMQKGESVGEGTKADDLKDEEVVDKLRAALKKKFDNAWVKIGRVNGWVSSSYHIKVAVRDQSAFWLSSGNWQSSNQPKVDPLADRPPQRTWLSKYNREWHAIVEHAGLAKTFEKYLLNDFSANVGEDGREALSLPDLLVPEDMFLPSIEEAALAFRYFKPLDATRTFTVRPLLTPDNYHKYVLALVEEAKSELLIQNQTFNAPGENHESLKELIDAVMRRVDAGVRVRIIFRVVIASKARETLTALKDYGVPDSIIKVQKNCHTKGVIVDRKKVLLGSQNWSNDGVSVNRDASLLFDDEILARYFADVFDHDWNNLAKKDIGSESTSVRVAGADEATPPGMVRLSWKDYMEMM